VPGLPVYTLKFEGLNPEKSSRNGLVPFPVFTPERFHTKKVSGNFQAGKSSSSRVKQRFQAHVNVMTLFAPVEELPDPGIQTFRILFHAGIPRCIGRIFYVLPFNDLN